MKKWLLCLAAVAVLTLGGWGGRDVGKLRPVQVLVLQTPGGKVQVQTDTGDYGRGEDLPKALEDLKKTALGWVELDTAEYLLLGEGTEEYLPQLAAELRPSCRLCSLSGEVELSQVGAFLGQHSPKLTLIQYLAGEKSLPRLISEEGRWKLVQE